jgi:pimeloyl-ACP methyl ester carboxylesterase
MDTTISRDGTRIAFERAGTGHPIIFITGAFNDHHTAAPLAKELESDHTVITYDRRARGLSGDTAPYAIERELEDLAALIELAGGSAAVFGFSSGAVLALRAAVDQPGITHLMLYEAPFALAEQGPTPFEAPGQLAALVEQGRRGDAVELFQRVVIGLPAEMIAQARQSPMWPALEEIAQSLVYDATITATLGVPTEEMIAVRTPILVLNGVETWPEVRRRSEALAAMLPAAERREVPGGQDHTIPPARTAAAMRAFLGG